MRALAKEYAQKGIDGIMLSIMSSGGNLFHGQAISTLLSATVYMGNSVIDTQEQLQEAFGESATINWYNGDTLLGSGMTYSLSSDSDKETITARLES